MIQVTAPVAQPLAGNRNVHLLWFGEGVSVLGLMTTTMVFPLLAVLVFDAGPGPLGLLPAATWPPWLLFSLPAGVWIDRGDPRRIMIAADLASAAVTASVPIAWALGRLTLVHVVLAALGVGAGAVFFRTADSSFVRVSSRKTIWRARIRVSSAPSRRCRSPGPGSAAPWSLSSRSRMPWSSTPSPSSSPRCAWSVWARPAGPARARSARTDGHVRPCRAADPHARSVCALRRGPRRRLEFRPDGLRRPHGPLPRPRPFGSTRGGSSSSPSAAPAGSSAPRSPAAPPRRRTPRHRARHGLAADPRRPHRAAHRRRPAGSARRASPSARRSSGSASSASTSCALPSGCAMSRLR